ncbi:hypothetical protein BH23CHL2_BH23CHL2_19410 [soil metagenome]
MLREAFIEIFHPANPQPFGSQALRYQGLSDGNEGVQWNAWIERMATGTPIAWLGVNLEGKQYRDWPIARLIQRELTDPKLITLRDDLRQPEEITVHWWRDAWGPGGSRIRGFEEHSIAPTPIALSKLHQQSWRQALREAQGCLRTPKGRRGKQWVTVQDQRREFYVSPHVTFLRQLPWPATAEVLRQAMQRAREQLQPLYDFATERST